MSIQTNILNASLLSKIWWELESAVQLEIERYLSVAPSLHFSPELQTKSGWEPSHKLTATLLDLIVVSQ